MMLRPRPVSPLGTTPSKGLGRPNPWRLARLLAEAQPRAARRLTGSKKNGVGEAAVQECPPSRLFRLGVRRVT